MSEIQPRKRAVQARSRATVDAILEATARILVEENLDAVTTNAIADRAGISIGSLYQYFPGRDAILAELLRIKLSVLLEDMKQAATHPRFEDAARGMLTALTRSYIERPAIVMALFYIESLVTEDRDIAAMRAALGQLVAQLLQDRDVPDLAVTARDVVAIARGMAISAGLAGETDEKAIVERMYRAVLGYLGHQPALSMSG